MAFPRVTAVICVLLLIGSVALLTVGGVAMIGPRITHSPTMEHEDGTIMEIGPGMDFVLKTATGRTVRFECDRRCLTGIKHMQRHMREHAHTDVYYEEEANAILVAEDVD